MKMKKLFKGLAVPLCVLLILLLCAAPAVADSVDLDLDYFDDDDPVAPHDDIVFSEWTSTTSLPTTAGNYKLMNDVSINKQWYLPTGVWNLDLNGHSIQFTGEFGFMIRVGKDAVLNLYDSVGTGIITGGKEKTADEGKRYNGGEVDIWGGNFTMYGGTLLGVYGYESRGVQVIDEGTFTLMNGTITNHASRSGGSVYIQDSTFVMRGGVITNNTASQEGGGVRVWNSSFIMYGGTISNNKAGITGGSGSGGGVMAMSNSSFVMYGGTISDNIACIDGERMVSYGGGIRLLHNCTFTLYDGIISNNNADSGSGVDITHGCTFEMLGGTICKNKNGPSYETGYSVSVYNSLFLLKGGDIRDNDCGIHVHGNGIIQMSGGNITKNTAERGAGGVYVREGTFVMSGGNISKNHVDSPYFKTGYSGGVYAHNGTFIISGGIISGNTAEYNPTPNNVYLENIILTIDETNFTENTKIGVTSDIIQTEGTNVAITGQNNADYSRYFFADNASLSIKNIDNVLYLAYDTVIEPVINTTDSVNAATAATVEYEIAPSRLDSIEVPTVTRGGRTLVLNETVVVMKIVGEDLIEVPAHVNEAGQVVVDGDISDADTITVTFIGRKIGDTIGNGRVDVSSNIKIARVLAGLAEMTEVDKFYGDINADGKLKVDDNIMLARHLAGILDENFEVIA